MKRASFCFLIIILWQLSNFVFSAIPASERAALIALYNSTNGDNWYYNKGWKTPPLHTDGFAMPGTEGSWQGVTLSGNHVSSIQLLWHNLSGSIPPELGNLSNLEYIDLYQNQLSGSIPPQLGNLSNLNSLELGCNQLSGSIPSELGNLINLKYLSFNENQLSGSIPPQLGNLSNLNSLGLSSNQLSGSIPSELGNLSNLAGIGLSSNQLSGSIPSELGNLSNLTRIGLSSNQLSGSIPSELGNLNNLKGLYLDGNQLSGCIPPELSNLSNLTWLNLGSNQLSGSIPTQLVNLSNLEWLNLGSNQLSGKIPPELGNLNNLDRLLLDGNQLSGSIPPELGNLSNLTWLNLGGNQLSGSIPPELGNLSYLNVLVLDHNQLSGSIPAELGNLSNLRWLNLDHNHLSGNIPSELGNLSNLLSLTLSSNQLRGGIPSELGNLNKIHLFYLHENQLSGSIPSELGNLSDLLFLALSSNQLSGSIPRELGNLRKVSYLDLRANQLSGSIPLELGKLSTLGVFFLDHNRLSGKIPSSFKNLTKIYDLDVGYNCLSAANSELIDWLNSHDPDWEATQCLEKAPPFGYFETPIHNSTVCSSIAVTGWALDDYGMDSVKIYCEYESTRLFIGHAIFVEGARPDVEAAYPGYPENNKAGWGYMLLTNFLPNGGNGTYVLHAIATDSYGKTTTLGSKTIIVDNAHAVKPFGAIDTPVQGGTASGSGFLNWGWALTPAPNKIPTDGSTIDVWIDGVNIGYPTYNIYRSDIASLFPNYANSNGAVGYFYLDTTKYTNGVHTIQWTAADNAGNIDGIGSRYFTVDNYDVSASAAANSLPGLGRHTGQIPGRSRHKENFGELLTEKGDFPRHNIQELALMPEEKGMNELIIKELDRVEFKLGENHGEIMGYLLCSDELKKLPIGSTLDAKTGTFYWSPGPGFLGRYSLVFVLTDPDGQSYKKSIEIEIVPRFNGLWPTD